MVKILTSPVQGDVSFGGHKATGLADPSSAQDAATKAYVDAVAQGLSVKASVRAASTANIASQSGLLTIDGVTLVDGDRVLAKDQATGSTNGIWVAHSGAWTRATDADAGAELVAAFVFVGEGTTNADGGWVQTAAAPITVGTTALTWAQFSGAGQIVAGAGLAKSGNTLRRTASATGYANLAALPSPAANNGLLERTADGGIYESDGSAWRIVRDPSGTFAPAPSVALYPTVPLDIPTPYATKDITHPSVWDAMAELGQNWNGYPKWMVATPYPPANHENPCLFVSNDGVKWINAPGVTNPFFDPAEAIADGYEYWSDNNIVYDAANGRLVCFAVALNNSSPKQAMYRKHSTDGVNWSARQKVIDSPGFNNKLASPSVVVEDDGTWTVWYVDDTLSTGRVKRATSSDAGFTWSAGASVTVDLDNGFFWHLDVKKVAGLYWMAIPEKNLWTVPCFSSADGITWIRQAAQLIPKAELAFDTRGHYKVAIVPRPGLPVAFDVYAPGLDGSGADAWADHHRIALYRNVDPTVGHPANLNDQLWIPSTQFKLASGTPTEVIINGRFHAWSFPHGSNNGVLTSFVLPTGWARAQITLRFANLTGVGGNVSWYLTRQRIVAGDVLNTNANESTVNQVKAAGASQNAIVSDSYPSYTVSSATLMSQLRVNRVGTDGTDTLAGAAGFLGCLVQRVL